MNELKETIQVNPEKLTVEEIELILELFYSWFEETHKPLIEELNTSEKNYRLFCQVTKKFDKLMYAELRKKGLYQLYISLLTPNQKFRDSNK